MANSTLSLTGLLTFLDPDSGVTPAVGMGANTPLTFQGTAHEFTENLFLVPTTAGGVTLPLGAVSSPGDAIFINRDSTNFITLYDAVSGNPLIQLDPGKPNMFTFAPGIVAPAVKADTASCRLQYFIVDRGDVSPAP
jgi:hypothetical protein